MKVVPVLLYHAVTTSPGAHVAPFTVSPDDFKRQLDAIVERDFECLTFSAYIDRRASLTDTDRIAVITFDDGYADFAVSAVPELATRNLASTIYLTSGWLEGGSRSPGPTDAMLSWSQVPELEEAGVEIAAHSHSHLEMDTLSDTQIVEELARPKELLEQCVGHGIRSFAYPHGYCGPRVQRLTRQHGYDSGAGVRNALTRSEDNTYNVARLMLGNDTTMQRFSQWLDAFDTPVAASRERLATKGWRWYRRSKAVIRRTPGSVYR